MDQASINPGDIFAWTIQQAAVHAKVMFVLIGQKWLTLTDRSGKRRIDDEADYVRREIVAALDRGALVVPILLPGTAMPDKHTLPTELDTLHDVQFYELNHRHWREDVGRLKAHVDAYLK